MSVIQKRREAINTIFKIWHGVNYEQNNIKKTCMQLSVLSEEIREAVTSIDHLNLHNQDGLRDDLADIAFVCHGVEFLTDAVEIDDEGIEEIRNLLGVMTGALKPLDKLNYMAEALESLADSIDVTRQEIMHSGIDSFNTRTRVNTNVLKAYAFARELNAMVGLDLNNDLDIVIASNLSKSDTSKEDFEKTKEKYAEIGVEVYCEVNFIDGVHYHVSKVKETVTVDGKEYVAGKTMKSWKWAEPVFAPLGITF